MDILLTNDDGIYAEGIQVMRKVLEEKRQGDNIWVVAPDRERSASGHAITIHRPLHVDEVRFEGSRSRAWAVNGTPADCTKIAVEALMSKPPDLVISGINRGPNLGTDVFYSGTVSAAIEGALIGIPSLAVSVAAFEHVSYELSAEFINLLIEQLAEEKLPQNTLLNINVPALEESEIAGVAVTRLGIRKWRDVFDRRIDPRGKVYYWLAGEATDTHNEPDSDVVAIKNNMISITPIHLDLTHHGLREKLAQLKFCLPSEVEREG